MNLRVAANALRAAGVGMDLVALKLQAARKDYASSDLPEPVKRARLAALDAKIAALRDIRSTPDAYPWTEDFK